MKRIILFLFTIYALDFSLGQVPEVEHNARIKLEKSLSSPKITDALRDKYLWNEKAQTEEPLFNIIIEFEGGNTKGLREFKAASDSGVLKATATRGETITNLVERLSDNAALSQKDVIEFLKERGSDFRSLWAANEIYVKGAGPDLVGEIASRFETVARVRPVGKVRPPRLPKPPTKPNLDLLKPKDVPWNVEHIRARCKDIKCRGEGVVVGIIDSGVLGTHVELKDNYRKEYGWYDPVNGTELPNFTSFHGTWVTSIAVGKTKGVAPDAQWIACKGFRIDFDEEVYLKACGEFMLCPFRWNNTEDKDCSKAPDIINCSWNAVPEEQLTFPADFYYGLVAAWNAAGIPSTFSAGNEGSYCNTINPPAAYDITFSVGATDNSSNIPWWSSRGPVLNGEIMGFKSGDYQFGNSVGSCQQHCNSPFDDGQVICTLTKPDIAAPGLRIAGADVANDTSYTVASGTSASSPVVAGVMALVICANNRVPIHQRRKLDVATMISILKSTASTDRINLAEGNDIKDPVNFQRNSNLLCNVAFGNKCRSFPNNLFGSGEVDACAAVNKVNYGWF